MYQPHRYIEDNVVATSQFLDAIGNMSPKPKRVILSSSRAVYGEGAFLDTDGIVYPGPRSATALASARWEVENKNGAPLIPVPTGEKGEVRPSSIYGMTKSWQEQLVTLFSNTYGVDFLVLRLQNVYGPLQQIENQYTGIITAFVKGIVRHNCVEVFEDGLMTRDFVFVRDVAQAILAGIKFPDPLGRILNVGSSRAVTLMYLVSSLAKILGKEPQLISRQRYRLGDVRHACADMSAYESIFGPWRPTSLEDGLKDYVRWFLDQPSCSSADPTASLDEMAGHGLLLEAR
jgi:dTDP-L-rhamnose 4-epimerase